jgi:acetyl-CoA/propionyl-CoA carboxylase biotin carboxyl carrier protein
MTQAEVDASRRGHAIEVRINAEDPAGGKFLPAPGTISRLEPPDGFGVRFDTGYTSGDAISQFYDNLVGKLIVWGRDRDVAIARTIRALDELVVEGVATTIPADLAILRAPEFRSVEHSTKWVEEQLDLSGVSSTPVAAPETDDDDPPLVRRSTTVEVNGRRFAVEMWVPDAPVAAVAAPGKKRARRGSAASSGAVGSGHLAAPMQGTIVKVLVQEGQEVEVGAGIVVLEAMKMENRINSETAGTVKEIRVAAGDTVGGGDVIAVIE